MNCPHQPCGICPELAKLDATKPTPQNFLDLIQKRHNLRSNYLNLWHDRLASRLPVEIVSRIFIFFDRINKPGEQEGHYMSPGHHRKWDHLLRTPCILSRVCRRWRNIVLGTPQLWTKFLFNVWTLSRKLDMLKEFLSRSGSLPLSLVLWGEDDTVGEECEGTLDPLATLIRSYSSRWEYLDIELVPEGFTEKILHGLEYIPPSVLKGLRIDYFDLAEPVPLREPLRPRDLCIFKLNDLGRIPLEWDNITHLELSDLPASTLLYIVKQIPRLVHWHSADINILSDLFEGPRFPLPQTPIFIPTLEHLDLTFKDNITYFLSHLTLPSLTHLECQFGTTPQFDHDLSLDNLIDFLARSELNHNHNNNNNNNPTARPLQTFSLKYNILGIHYDRRFTDLPCITHLSIQVDGRRNLATSRYLSAMSDISVLPNLRQLRVGVVPDIPPSSWAHLCDVFREGRVRVPTSDLTVVARSASASARRLPCPGWGRGDCLLHPANHDHHHDHDHDPNPNPNPDPDPDRLHKRPLEHVSVKVYKHQSPPTIIPRADYLFLRDIQNAGVVQLEIKDVFEFTSPSPRKYQEEDILEKMARFHSFINDLSES